MAKPESKWREAAYPQGTAVHTPRAGWTGITRAMTKESFHGRFVSTGTATAVGGASRSGCGTAASSSCTSWGRLLHVTCVIVELMRLKVSKYWFRAEFSTTSAKVKFNLLNHSPFRASQFPQSNQLFTQEQNATSTLPWMMQTARRPSPSPTGSSAIVQWSTNGTDSLAAQESKCRPRACQSTTAVHTPRAGWTEITREMTRESFHGRFVSTGAATAAGGASRSGCGTAAISSCTSWGRLQPAAFATVDSLLKDQ